MKANELRIGNLLLIPEPGSTVKIPAIKAQVQEIGLFGDLLFLATPQQEGVRVNIKHCAPIPLTEELLAKCGFENNSIDNKFVRNNVLISHQRDSYDIYRFILLFDEKMVFIRQVKHLHQLQNLYFAITGEELDVKF